MIQIQQKIAKIVKDYFFALAMVAMIAGFSAFKVAEANKAVQGFVYGQLADGTWIPLDDTNYECEFLEDRVCTAVFASPVPPAKGATNWISIDRNDGVYTPIMP